MNLQFNCPACQLLMTADANLAGNQVQCPSCGQVFMIGAHVAALPVVQARAAEPSPPARPSAPRKAVPGRPGARPGQPPARGAASTHPKAEAGEGMAKVALVLMLLAGIGLIYGAVRLVSYMSGRVTKDVYAMPEEVKKRDEERKARLRAEQAEQKAEEAKERELLLTFLTKQICDGDDKVANELLQIFDSIRAAHDKLATDADANNDPKDVRKFWQEQLTLLADKNNVVHHWLGGRPPAAIFEAIWGDDSRERGKTPEFLLAGGYSGTGTGFYIAPDGLLLTNEHVVRNAAQVDVRGADGKIRPATVVKADAEADIALLRTAEPATAWLPISFSDLPMGGSVFTIGFPNATVQGVEPKFTDGRISSLTGYRDDADAYQTTVPVQQGNSGGALVDLKSGSVAGIVAAVLGAGFAENVSYAIKGSKVEKFIRSTDEAESILAAGKSAPSAADETAMIGRATSATVLVLVR